MPAYLKSLREPDKNINTFRLRDDHFYKIGRGPFNTIYVAEYVAEGYPISEPVIADALGLRHGVSRDHLAMVCAVGNIVLGDIGSTNGSFLDGNRFFHKIITDSDDHILKLGNIGFLLRNNGEEI